jgi:hypothetical protein
VSILAFVCTVIGLYLLTKKNKTGWVVCTAGSLIWVVYFALAAEWFTAATFVVYILANIKGWFDWRKEEQEKESLFSRWERKTNQWTRPLSHDDMKAMKDNLSKYKHEV